ncbi:hypothetical protein GOBAR_DD08999 [Gossypium barbadense]|nr:hypothetical protein GOBAR_DD08999 [Gossypium barbadense]
MSAYNYLRVTLKFVRYEETSWNLSAVILPSVNLGGWDVLPFNNCVGEYPYASVALAMCMKMLSDTGFSYYRAYLELPDTSMPSLRAIIYKKMGGEHRHGKVTGIEMDYNTFEKQKTFQKIIPVPYHLYMIISFA